MSIGCDAGQDNAITQKRLYVDRSLGKRDTSAGILRAKAISQMSYSLERDGKGYVIDTHEPGKNIIIPNINPDSTMTLNMGLGILSKFERVS
jgi:hypothetical protein